MYRDISRQTFPEIDILGGIWAFKAKSSAVE